ncbi:hypothetical protein SteCoe_30828 [Stentor coeruleus]|uniref:Uncharacterized protein n=1 Tax=Stentor coeruleus TaxID=5963 RepID=A0A1R2B2Q9_9CILI|nr:hypothetical protein SteCoe_30828 [Stentor coeruleus]
MGCTTAKSGRTKEDAIKVKSAEKVEVKPQSTPANPIPSSNTANKPKGETELKAQNDSNVQKTNKSQEKATIPVEKPEESGFLIRNTSANPKSEGVSNVKGPEKPQVKNPKPESIEKTIEDWLDKLYSTVKLRLLNKV